jgi:hypothetical protein
MNGGTDPFWQAQDMDSENFRGARLIPKTENRKPKSNHGFQACSHSSFFFGEIIIWMVLMWRQ